MNNSSAAVSASATSDAVHANVGISQSDSIKVAVRVRPLNDKEQNAVSSQCCVQIAQVRCNPERSVAVSCQHTSPFVCGICQVIAGCVAALRRHPDLYSCSTAHCTSDDHAAAVCRTAHTLL
jgi:hypothetical protein